MISVDGDTSTNDTVLLLANGLAGNKEITEKNEDYHTFCRALKIVNETLAKKMAGDGEGCTALFEVKVVGAETKEQAKILAKSVICSSLTKAAIFGHGRQLGQDTLRHGLFRGTSLIRKGDLYLRARQERWHDY